MGEPLHETADEGFHEIQLSGKQLVFLFMATTVVSVVIFLCGVLVGRGVHAQPSSDPMQASATPPPSATPTPNATPPPTPAPANPPAETQPPTATPPEPAAAPPAVNELTYKKRLESEGAVAEDRLKSGAAQKSQANPQSAAKSPTPAAPPEASPPSPAATSGARPGKWVVQIVALRDRPAASSLVQRLVGKGYPAFIVNPTANAPAQVYKVQVGRFDDRREAEQVKRRLEKEEKFTPWISR